MTEFRYFAYEETRPDDHVVYFDMDGTVADLYAVDGWLDMLLAYDPYPYANAAPMIDYDELVNFAENVHDLGWKIGILSWLSKEPTPEYDKAVIDAKLEWLERFFPAADEIVIVSYGVPKYEIVAPAEAILIDDEALNRMHWDASGPLRRSYPADELLDLMNLIMASANDSFSGESDLNGDGVTTIEELVAVIDKRMLLSVGYDKECPQVSYDFDGQKWSVLFLNRDGTAYYSPYFECVVPIGDPGNLTQEEINRIFAKADRLVYDTV